MLLLHICFLRLAIGAGRGGVAILPVRRAGIIALVCISGRAVGLLIILARLARVLICAGGGIAAVVAGGGLIILPRLAVRLLITLARIIPGVKRGNAALRCAWRGGGLGLLRRGSLRLRHGFRLCGGGFLRALRCARRAYGPGLFFGFGLGLDGGKLAAAVHDDIDKFTLAIFGDGFNTLKLCDLSQIAQGFFQQLISGQNAAPFKKRKIYKQISYLRCVYIGSAISIMPILMKLKRYIWGFYPFFYRQYHIIVKYTHLSRRNV